MPPAPASLAPIAVMTPDVVRETYAELQRTAPGPHDDAATWLTWFKRWNQLKCRLDGDMARLSFKEAQDTRDPEAEAALRFAREQIQPLFEAGEGALRPLLLASPARAAFEEAFGPQLFERLALQQAAFTPANIPLHVEEADKISQYQRLMGSAALQADGQTLTLTQAVARLNAPEAAVRHAAWQAIGGWMGSQKEALHGLYDGLVSLRHRMAEGLGAPDFVTVGYRRMGRSDYGPAEVATFRAGIERHVVPVLAKLRAEQARMLGTSTVKAWDQTYFPGLSLGTNVVPVEHQLAQAQVVFDRLHPTLAGHFKRMVDERLIDLENRPGKRPGAFAVGFNDELRIAIFCNSTGAETDVSTLMHEMGHAFQGWESLWVEPNELRWPTMDACEVHSMGMEFLSLKAIEAFFDPEQAARYRRLKLINTLTRLPYMALVDDFQHWVYSHPAHDHTRREAAWDERWARYQPAVDYTGEEAHRQYRWMRQQHLFSSPFYYIDYAIAEVGAMQLWRMAEADHGAAMQAYLTLCKLGGTKSLLAMFEAGGLRSPFDPDVLGPLMDAVAEELGL